MHGNCVHSFRGHFVIIHCHPVTLCGFEGDGKKTLIFIKFTLPETTSDFDNLWPDCTVQFHFEITHPRKKIGQFSQSTKLFNFCIVYNDLTFCPFLNAQLRAPKYCVAISTKWHGLILIICTLFRIDIGRTIKVKSQSWVNIWHLNRDRHDDDDNLMK